MNDTEKKELSQEELERVSGGLYADDSTTGRAATSADKALQGKAAGVQAISTAGQPGAEMTIRVRSSQAGISFVTE